MQVILAGSFAFNIVDRLSGGSLNMTPPDWCSIDFGDLFVRPESGFPLWFVLNMLWLLFTSFVLLRIMQYLREQASCCTHDERLVVAPARRCCRLDRLRYLSARGAGRFVPAAIRSSGPLVSPLSMWS